MKKTQRVPEAFLEHFPLPCRSSEASSCWKVFWSFTLDGDDTSRAREMSPRFGRCRLHSVHHYQFLCSEQLALPGSMYIVHPCWQMGNVYPDTVLLHCVYDLP